MAKGPTLKDVSTLLKTHEPTAATVERARLTVNITADVIERARDIAYWDPEQTVAGLVERGLRAEIKRLERKLGEPYPSRRGELKRGRPIR